MTNEERRQHFWNALEEKRHILRTAVNGMVSGDLIQALNIAIAIRALIHESASNKPLLKSLRANFLDLPILGMVLATSANPLRIPMMAQVSTQEPHLRLIAEVDGARTERLALGHWWRGPFVVLPETDSFSRRDVVVGLADKEAAHVDANIPERFKRLVECDKFQWQVNDLKVTSINLSRLIVGGAAVELLGYLDDHFKGP